MNPRDFLREPGYPIALLTTYSFDPHFFERLVLPDLWAGGSNSVLVLVDHATLRTALNSHLGDLRHLGRRYFLQPVEWRGAFHPKVFLRLGDEGGLVWVGSNNLTRGGWGGNSELGGAWRLDRNELDGGGWLPSLLSYLDTTTTGFAKELLEKAQRLPWLGEIPVDGRHDVLCSHRETIGDRVSARWAGRRFKSLKVLTGSTDRDAGFLGWVAETFGIEDIDICVTPECASFEASALGDLGARVRFVPPPGRKLMHAKFYWFEGPDGSAALWGSANCSRSAWLITGQNLEAMVIEDAPEADQYAEILQVFEQEAVDASSVLVAPQETGQSVEPPPPSLRIVAASAEASGRVEVEVEPPIPPDRDVLMEIGGGRVRLDGAARNWTGELSGVAEDSHVATVRVLVEGPGSEKCWSDVRWIDRLAELREVLAGTDFRATMGAMVRFESRAADRRLAHELGRIGMALLTDRSSYPDVTRPSRRRSEKKDEGHAPLDPEALIVSLGESDSASGGLPRGTLSHYGINGVFRALFAQLDDDHLESQVVDGDGGEPDPTGSSRSGTAGTDESPLDVDRKTSEVLQRHMERFLSEYEAHEFATGCTATQLAQATAYPILVAAMGQRRNWCTDDQRRGWVSRTVRALLKDDRFHHREALLTFVRRRYEEEGQSQLFDQAIGDGQLWLALLGAWSLLPSGTTEELLQQVTLFRDFVSRRELVGSAEPSRVTGLFSAFWSAEVIKAACSRALRFGSSLLDLERALERSYEELKSGQVSMKLKHTAGELVWSPKGGWGIVKTNQHDGKVDVYVAKGDDVRTFRAHGWLVNVSQVGATAGAPAELLDRVDSFLRGLENVDEEAASEGQ